MFARSGIILGLTALTFLPMQVPALDDLPDASLRNEPSGPYPAGDSCAAGATTSVSIGGVNNQHFTFHPSVVNIAAGGVVTWTNNAPVDHTTTEDYPFDDNDLVAPVTKTVDPPLWDSGPLAGSGVGTFSHKFCEPGTFTYHCEIHRFMQGTVEVS